MLSVLPAPIVGCFTFNMRADAIIQAALRLSLGATLSVEVALSNCGCKCRFDCIRTLLKDLFN